MAELDLPAVLDKVLKETSQTKIYLAGHSMGATVPSAFLSENNSFDDKVILTFQSTERRKIQWSDSILSTKPLPSSDFALRFDDAGIEVRLRYTSAIPARGYCWALPDSSDAQG